MANFCIERSEAIKKKINKTPKPDATEKPLSESDQLALLAQLDDLKPFSEEIDGVSQEGSDDVSQEDPHGVNQSPAERSGGQSSASRLTPEEIRVSFSESSKIFSLKYFLNVFILLCALIVFMGILYC